MKLSSDPVVRPSVCWLVGRRRLFCRAFIPQRARKFTYMLLSKHLPSYEKRMRTGLTFTSEIFKEKPNFAMRMPSAFHNTASPFRRSPVVMLLTYRSWQGSKLSSLSIFLIFSKSQSNQCKKVVFADYAMGVTYGRTSGQKDGVGENVFIYMLRIVCIWFWFH